MVYSIYKHKIYEVLFWKEVQAYSLRKASAFTKSRRNIQRSIVFLEESSLLVGDHDFEAESSQPLYFPMRAYKPSGFSTVTHAAMIWS
jgi:hypothetical protein